MKGATKLPNIMLLKCQNEIIKELMAASMLKDMSLMYTEQR